MAKLYLVSLEENDTKLPSMHWLFKNKEDAQQKVEEQIGSNILDLIANHDFYADSDVGDVIQYVKALVPYVKDDDDYGCDTKFGKIYVEELEVQE